MVITNKLVDQVLPGDFIGTEDESVEFLEVWDFHVNVDGIKFWFIDGNVSQRLPWDMMVDVRIDAR